MPAGPPTATGTLAKTPLAHLLVYMFDRKLGGSITFQDPTRQDHIVMFADGTPAKARTGFPVEHLGRLLFELGYIDEKTHDSSLASLTHSGGLHGQILVSSGQLDQPRLLAGLREQTFRRVVRLFEQLPDESTYSYYQGQNLLDLWGGPELTPVDPWRILWIGVRSRPDAPHVEETLARLGTSRVSVPSEADLRGFQFETDELVVVEMLRTRPMPLSAILACGVLPERTLRLLTYVLYITRNLEIMHSLRPGGSQIPAAEAKALLGLSPSSIPPQHPKVSEYPARASDLHTTPPPRLWTPAPPNHPDFYRIKTPQVSLPPNPDRFHTSPVPAVGQARRNPTPLQVPLTGARSISTQRPVPLSDSNRPQPPHDDPQAQTPRPRSDLGRAAILARASTIQDENYFKVLSVADDAPADVIESAFLVLAQKWDPANLPHDFALVHEAAFKVHRHIHEAYTTLSDPECRRRYTENIRRVSAPNKAVQMELARADFQKAEVFLKRHELAQAETHAKKAMDADPDNADYVSLYAWLMSLRPERRLSNSYDDILEILSAAAQRSPDSERAHLYCAKLLKELGRFPEAMAKFRRVLEINPHNVDAAREVHLQRASTAGHLHPAPPRSLSPRPASKAPPKEQQGDTLRGLLNKLFRQ